MKFLKITKPARYNRTPSGLRAYSREMEEFDRLDGMFFATYITDREKLDLRKKKRLCGLEILKITAEMEYR